MSYKRLKNDPEHNPKSLFKNANGNLENTLSMLLKTKGSKHSVSFKLRPNPALRLWAGSLP